MASPETASTGDGDSALWRDLEGVVDSEVHYLRVHTAVLLGCQLAFRPGADGAELYETRRPFVVRCGPDSEEGLWDVRPLLTIRLYDAGARFSAEAGLRVVGASEYGKTIDDRLYGPELRVDELDSRARFTLDSVAFVVVRSLPTLKRSIDQRRHWLSLVAAQFGIDFSGVSPS